jgi:integrase
MANEHIRQRGRQWYFTLGIPRSLRHFFLSQSGKPMSTIEQPLGDSFEQARIEGDRRAANYRELFARLRDGEPMTAEQVRQQLSFSAADFDRVRREEAIALRKMLAGMRDQTRELFDQWDRENPMPPLTSLSPSERARELAALDVLREMGQAPAASTPIAPAAGDETVSQAAEAWIKEMTRDKSTAPRPQTIEGHRQRVQAFIDGCGDLPLTDATPAVASDFLRELKVVKRTRNAYATTLKCVFDDARKRGRFTGDNPFDGMKVKGLKAANSSYVPFTVGELQTLFDSLPRQVAPKKHSPETALPWAALIALYTGARLEEIAQLSTGDFREEPANGASVWIIDIHNGGANKLKNESAARLVPLHSALVHAGFLNYVKALPAGPLFPGLKARASKGGKVGARLGELFRKRLVRLGLKRKGLCFHSFRHTVANRLDMAVVRQSDAARVLGHAVAGISYKTYSQAGPGLIQVKATVEKIAYEGLRL